MQSQSSDNKTQVKKEPLFLGFTKRFILTLVAVALVGAGAVYFYVGSSNRGINLEVNLPEDIIVGDIFEADVIFHNGSGRALQDVSLVLNLPPGLRLLENRDRVNETRDLGDVARGGSIKESYLLVALPGDSEEDHTLLVRASYLTGALSANFGKRKEVLVGISNSEFILEMNAPDGVVPGQEFTVELSYRAPQRGGRESLDRFLVIENSEITILGSSADQHLPGRWLVEDDGGELAVVLRVAMNLNDGFTLGAKLVVDFHGQDFVVLEEEKEILLPNRFLSISLGADGVNGTVPSGELVTYTISYSNDTAADVYDVVITAELIGEAFDMSSIITDGSLDVVNGIIVWHPSRFNSLAVLPPGEVRSFSFSARAQLSDGAMVRIIAGIEATEHTAESAPQVIANFVDREYMIK